MFNYGLTDLPPVWCWGWDGAGDLDGPDVEPIWEKMSERSTTEAAVSIKHDRGLKKVDVL